MLGTSRTSASISEPTIETEPRVPEYEVNQQAVAYARQFLWTWWSTLGWRRHGRHKGIFDE